MNRGIQCPSCEGSGFCPKCNHVNPSECGNCNKSGLCPRCNGTGEIPWKDRGQDVKGLTK